MDKIIPLISSNVAGPLGLVHLPRIWQKCLLGAVGKLPAGYKECGPGFDTLVLGAIGVNPEDAKRFIRDAKPSYPEFEAWIRAYPGAKLDKPTIEQSNAAVIGYNHDDDTRKEILEAAGIADTGAVRDAVTLNNIEDWTDFHKKVTAA